MNNFLGTTKGKVIALLLALAALVTIVWAGVASLSSSSSKSSSSKPSDASSSSAPASKSASPAPVNVPSEAPIVHGATGKSIVDDQKDAEAAATKILNIAGNSPDKKTSMQRLQELDKNNLAVLDKNIFPLVRFSSNANAGLRKNTWQSLISINMILNKQNKANAIAPTSKDTYKNVFVDQQLGEAFVPLNNFAKNGAQLSLEMVYANKQWVLAPYSLVDAVKLSAALASGQNGGVTGQTPSSSASPSSSAAK